MECRATAFQLSHISNTTITRIPFPLSNWPYWQPVRLSDINAKEIVERGSGGAGLQLGDRWHKQGEVGGQLRGTLGPQELVLALLGSTCCWTTRHPSTLDTKSLVPPLLPQHPKNK